MRKNLLTIVILIAATTLLTSCATTHPNEKLIVGRWKTVSVEKVLPEDSPMNTQTGTAAPANDPRSQPAGDARTGDKGSQGDSKARAEEQFNRLYRAEQKATLEVYEDKVAVKDFNGTYVKATWKMKSNGTKLVAKSIKTKDKYVMEILELSQDKAVILEILPVGSLKITYQRQ